MIDLEFEVLSNREYDYGEKIRIWWSVSEIGGFTGKVIDIKLKETSILNVPFKKYEIIYLIKFSDSTIKDRWIDESSIVSKYKPMEK